jgi:hypothetical protein
VGEKMWAVEIKHQDRGWERFTDPVADEREARRLMDGLREAQLRAPFRLIELEVLKRSDRVVQR